VAHCCEKEQNADDVNSVFSAFTSKQSSMVLSNRAPMFRFVAVSQSRVSVVGSD
jgi:hypothetical protein